MPKKESSKTFEKKQPSKIKQAFKKAVLVGGMGMTALLGASTLEGLRRHNGNEPSVSQKGDKGDDRLEELKAEAKIKSDRATEELRRFIAGKSLPGDELYGARAEQTKIDDDDDRLQGEFTPSELHPDYTDDLPVDTDEPWNEHTQELFTKLEKAGKYGADNYVRIANSKTIFEVHAFRSNADENEDFGESSTEVTICALEATPDGRFIIYRNLEDYGRPWQIVNEQDLERTLGEISKKKI